MVNKRLAETTFYSILIISLLVILFGWWHGSGSLLATSGERLNAIGRLFGLLATLSVLLEVILLSRIPLIENNFSLEETIDLHRWNGYFLLFAIAAHVSCNLLGYSMSSHLSLWGQYVQFNSSFEDVFNATIGTVIFFSATVVTLRFIRKHLNYEVWYLSHLLIYFAILLTFGHQMKVGGDFVTQPWLGVFWWFIYLATFGLLFYYRFLRVLQTYFQHRFVIESVTKEADKIFSLHISGKNIHKYKFLAGQYATWRFFSKQLWHEAHPFSFSSVPGQASIRITFKVHGDFSEKLIDIAPGTKVLIDGPRGSFIANHTKTPTATLIAGGVGITPFMSIIPSLLERNIKPVLVYSVKKQTDVAFLPELNAWKNSGLEVHYHVTGKQGRITKELLQPYLRNSQTVYICGPEPMAVAVKNIVKNAGIKHGAIITERYAY